MLCACLVIFVLIAHRLFKIVYNQLLLQIFLCQVLLDWDKPALAMGVSGKWIRALIGLKKSVKPESSEKDGNVSFSVS